MNFCLSDLVPPLRWSDSSTITLLTGQPDLPEAWWRSLPMPRVLAAIGAESLGELLTEIALEHWPAAAVGDVLPALHVLDPEEADEPAVAIALDRAGSWAGLLALTSRELVDQPFIQARPVLNTLFSAVLVRMASSRAAAPAHPAPVPHEAAQAVEAAPPAPAEVVSEPAAAEPAPAQPTQDASEPSHHATELSHEASEQSHDGLDQSHDGLERSHRDLERSHGDVEPSAAAEEPEAAAAEAEPASQEPDPVVSFAPVSVVDEPEPAAAAPEPAEAGLPAEQAPEAERPEEVVASHEGAPEEPGQGEAEHAGPGQGGSEDVASDQGQHEEIAPVGDEPVSGEAVSGEAVPDAQQAFHETPEPQPHPEPEPQPEPQPVLGAGEEPVPEPAAEEPPAVDEALAMEEPAESPAPQQEPAEAPGPQPEPAEAAALQQEPAEAPGPQPEPAEAAALQQEPPAEAPALQPEPPAEAAVVQEEPVEAEALQEEAAEAAASQQEAAEAPAAQEGPAEGPQPLPELIEAAFAGLDDKSWAVAQNRVFTDEPSAVDQLAKLFAVPPAEISATENEFRTRLDHWLASDEAAPYRKHLDELRRTLGPAVHKEQVIGAADWHNVEIRALEVPAWQFVWTTLAPSPRPQQQPQSQPQSQPALGAVQTPPPPPGPPQFQAFAPAAPPAEEANGEAEHKPYQPLKDVSQTRRCFRQPDGRWWLRIDVTAEQLAGGECTLPTGFASYLGLSPGENRTVRSAAGELTMAWHGRPVLQSIERLLVDVGAREGGHLFLTLSDEGVLRARHLPVAAQGAEKITKALRLVGYTAPGGTRDQAARVIATRIGMTGPVSLPDLLTRLRERGDRDLIALLD